MKLGEVLADMVLYGDIEEAAWSEAFHQMFTNPNNGEHYFRLSIAATLLKLTNGGEGGSCSQHDETVRPFLQMEVKNER